MLNLARRAVASVVSVALVVSGASFVAFVAFVADESVGKAVAVSEGMEGADSDICRCI